MSRPPETENHPSSLKPFLESARPTTPACPLSLLGVPGVIRSRPHGATLQ
ncbi:MAG: hypothetical protein AB7P49_13145 [Bdellovibrionales bacterium]